MRFLQLNLGVLIRKVKTLRYVVVFIVFVDNSKMRSNFETISARSERLLGFMALIFWGLTGL